MKTSTKVSGWPSPGEACREPEGAAVPEGTSDSVRDFDSARSSVADSESPRSRSENSRRDFLQMAGASWLAAGLPPTFIRPSALGLQGAVPPSDRLVMASIGCGGKGRHNTGEFLKFPEVQWVAACDVDEQHAQADKAQVDRHFQNTDCRVYQDLREMLAREQLDAVHVSTPDHWHAAASLAAMQAGCDVYCEKPLANSVGEAIAIRRGAERYGRVVQTGSHERSNPKIAWAVQQVREGRWGKVTEVQVNMPCGDEDHHQQVLKWAGVPEPTPVPPHLDWNLWLGPAAEAPYHERRSHFWWRFILAYGGGEMSDRGAHILDIAQWALGRDDSGPIEFSARGQRRVDNLYDAFMDYQFECRYDDGVRIVGVNQGPRGLKISGESGWVFIHIHGGDLETSDAAGIQVPTEGLLTTNHHHDFLDCVRRRGTPRASAAIGCRTATLCHLLNIALEIQRPLRWDPVRESILNDSEAGQRLLPAIRSPWRV